MQWRLWEKLKRNLEITKRRSEKLINAFEEKIEKVDKEISNDDSLPPIIQLSKEQQESSKPAEIPMQKQDRESELLIYMLRERYFYEIYKENVFYLCFDSEKMKKEGKNYDNIVSEWERNWEEKKTFLEKVIRILKEIKSYCDSKLNNTNHEFLETAVEWTGEEWINSSDNLMYAKSPIEKIWIDNFYNIFTLEYYWSRVFPKGYVEPNDPDYNFYSRSTYFKFGEW